MIKLGRSETISHTFYNDDAAADAGSVTVTATDADNVVLYTGTAIKEGDTYSFIMPPPAKLGKIDIKWVGTILSDITDEEVIGDYLFELWELKALLLSRGVVKPYEASVLRAIRDAVTDTFESVTNRSFVLRRKTVRVSVVGTSAFLPTVDVRQVLTVDGAAFTGDVTPEGCVSGLSGSSCTLVYEYGPDAVSAEAKTNALNLAIYLVGAQTRKTPESAESVTDTNGTTYRLALAGVRGVQVPIPSVDAYLKRYRFEMPGVA